jgi:hypothetical protein
MPKYNYSLFLRGMAEIFSWYFFCSILNIINEHDEEDVSFLLHRQMERQK